MPTKYVVRAERNGERKGALTRQTREGAFRAAEALMDAHGENTKVSIEWEMCGDLSTVSRGLFE